MRNLHLDIEGEFWEECHILLWLWEYLVKKMVDNSSHRRFWVACLSAGITPVSIIGLKNMVRT